MVYADCEHLQPDNRCGVYETRPQICRDYTTDDCEYDSDACYDQFFETADQIWEYAEAVLPPRKRKTSLSELRLPVLT
jgi:Fe-S-cluster containining protein